ncbi:SKA complex subunit 1-like [Rhipicephalus microplus]|uniref:SKA complex subunit 1-like n=1 Tax=Rhipicephalus microplus TaxID=6941 RepID=UPI003F6BF2B6
MEEYIARLHHSLEVLKLCVSLCKVSTDDAYFVKNARAKLGDASEHQRRIDELFKQYEEVKEREAKILTDLEVRVQLAECQRSFVESLPPKSQPSGVATQGSSLAAGDRPCRQQVTAGSKHVTKLIAPLSEEQFSSVPKYMKGRFTLAAINKLVDGFNKAIASKYELLALPKSRLKEAQWKRVTAYHTQETAETKRLSFVVDADLTGKSGGGAAFESSRVVTQFAVVMRHCGRIREIRGPELIVRYVVV